MSQTCVRSGYGNIIPQRPAQEAARAQARRVLSVHDCAVAQMQIRQAENERLLRQYAAARNEVQTLREQLGRRTPSPRGSRSVREPFRSPSFHATTQTAAARDAQECARQ